MNVIIKSCVMSMMHSFIQMTLILSTIVLNTKQSCQVAHGCQHNVTAVLKHIKLENLKCG